jgi:hypothetical protein
MDSVDIQKWKLMDAEPINGKNITEVLESNTDSPISINFEVWFGNFLNKPIRLLSQTPTMFVKDYDGRMVHSNPVQTRLYSYMLINYDDLTLNMTYDFSFDQRKLENDIKVESLHSYNQ